jgi:hypothetical protein
MIKATWVAWLVAPTVAFADPHLTVATDATPWLFKGYSAALFYEPNEKLRIGGEIWGMTIPTPVVELSAPNRDENWHHRVLVAFAVYLDRHVGPFHIGGAVNLARSYVDRGGPDSGRFWAIEVMARTGYRLVAGNLFVDPWLGVGPFIPVETLPVVAGEKFSPLPIQLVGTIHLGARY